ncbi:hypothetical protein SAMN05421874_11624 [Nonomuraea maritima]|uniref:Uncharacterized protein n=1 Tax=Nonomuraea maritima TaxID=683260 RepID=A0A1G9HHC0_9ACTN|nr:hypothetical protein SAMN05421874_11624 [Nonomuraea maritima]
MYRLPADMAALSHLFFLVHLVVGGFLVWRRRRTIGRRLAFAARGSPTSRTDDGTPPG